MKYALIISLIIHLVFASTMFSKDQNSAIIANNVNSANAPLTVKLSKAQTEPTKIYRETKKVKTTKQIEKSSIQPTQQSKIVANIETEAQTIPFIDNPNLASNRVAPKYPKRSLMLKQEGLVILKALISEYGQVKTMEILKSSGYNLLDEAAQQAVEKWEFEPLQIAGRTSLSWVKVPVEFKIQ